MHVQYCIIFTGLLINNNGEVIMQKRKFFIILTVIIILPVISLSAQCGANTEDKIDIINTFIVLSGDDMNNSIHRPERCLAAQGFEILASEERVITINDNIPIPVRRLVSRHLNTGLEQVSYYWFTGAKVITAGHYSRTITDILDRLTTGTNQRWAFVTITSPIIKGENTHPFAQHSIEETDFMVTDFISKIFGEIHNTEQIGISKQANPS